MNPENNEKKENVTPPKIISHVSSGNSWLNDVEAKGPGKTRIVLPSALKKHHPMRNVFIWLIIFAALGFGGYKLYPKYWLYVSTRINKLINKTEQNNPLVQNDAVPAVNSVATDDQQIASDTSATLAQTASSTSAVVASSTPQAGSGPSAVSTTTPIVISSPPVSGSALKVNSNSLGYLNVRGEPSSSAKIVIKVYPGETYHYTQEKYGWYLIVLPSGQTGWVSGQYVTLQ